MEKFKTPTRSSESNQANYLSQTDPLLLRSKSCVPNRKLPVIPADSDCTAIDFKKSGGSSSGIEQVLHPFFLEYSLLAELKLYQKQEIPGIYLIPSSKTSLVWNGVMFIRQGLYKSGIFRFKIAIPENFPDCECPSFIFTPPVFHPLIHDVTGELDVKKSFGQWKRNFHHIWNLVQFAKRIFMNIEISDALNKDAALLFIENSLGYKEKVNQSIELCNLQLYQDPDPQDDYSISFTKLDDESYETIKKQMNCFLSNDGNL